MRQAVILLEEESARIVVENIATRLQLNSQVITIPHEGKQDLERSIQNKLLRWRSAVPPRFLILRDNDRGNCADVKDRVRRLVPDAAANSTKIRIVMQELESWYLGDMPALEAAGLLKSGDATRLSAKVKFRTPDEIANPKQELLRLVEKTSDGARGQILLARRVSPHLNLNGNRSSSFIQFISALRWAAAPDSP